MELFKHQQEALEQTKGLNRVAYYLDMGLGKTFFLFKSVILKVCIEKTVFKKGFLLDERI